MPLLVVVCDRVILWAILPLERPAVYAVFHVSSRPAVFGSKHRRGGLPSRSTVNGWTERDRPVDGTMLAAAPVSTPRANLNMMRGRRSVAFRETTAVRCHSSIARAVQSSRAAGRHQGAFNASAHFMLASVYQVLEYSRNRGMAIGISDPKLRFWQGSRGNIASFIQSRRDYAAQNYHG